MRNQLTNCWSRSLQRLRIDPGIKAYTRVLGMSCLFTGDLPMAIITTRDNVSIYAKIWGQGRPVILIHGWPLSADSWDDVAMSLVEAGYQTIAYDRRGFGRSGQPWDGYDYNTLSDDLADVMKFCKVEEATLVGFSMGGGEVARYMTNHSGMHVRSIALVSSIVPYMLQTLDNPQGVPAETFAAMDKALRTDRAAFMASFFKDFFGVGIGSKPVSNELLEWTRSIAMQASLKATVQCANAFANTDFRPDLKSIRVPALIVHGTEDKTVPINASGRAAAIAIPNSTLHEYQGAPHGLFATHRDKLTEDLLAFLKQS
jgi:non-heme chloroperoxidase